MYVPLALPRGKATMHGMWRIVNMLSMPADLVATQSQMQYHANYS
jgi:hypothetical protein